MTLTNEIIEQLEKHGSYAANRGRHPNFDAVVEIIDRLEAEGVLDSVERHQESQTGNHDIDFIRARRDRR
jgi:hypothetical protein